MSPWWNTRFEVFNAFVYLAEMSLGPTINDTQKNSRVFQQQAPWLSGKKIALEAGIEGSNPVVWEREKKREKIEMRVRDS